MRILIFVLFIPLAIAVGHDLYINYYLDKDRLDDLMRFVPNIKDFRMSDLGWVWNEYAPTSMEVIRDSVAESTWNNFYTPILMMPSMWVTGAIFVGAVLISWAIKISRGENPINFEVRGARKHSNHTVYKHAKAKSMKFTRKN
ncbi:MAG: hypothetical protein AAF244_02955 [Pseudomonadota bacterium]